MTGFNYLKLGLQDVLLDTKTNTIYTPNTNQMVRVGELVPNMGLKSAENGGIMDEKELRKKTNWVKGA